jgi:putative tricarboxylic transport membrane protein
MKNVGVWIGSFMLIFSGIIFWESRSMTYYNGVAPGPGFLPLWLSGILFVLSILYIFRSLKKEIILFSKVLPKGKGLGNIVTLIGSVVLFIIMIPYAGFVISSIVMLFLLFKRGYKWYWGLGLSVVVTMIIFVIFDTMLQVPLPVNDFGF